MNFYGAKEEEDKTNRKKIKSRAAMVFKIEKRVVARRIHLYNIVMSHSILGVYKIIALYYPDYSVL